jgi:hypothetical protein
MPRDTAAMDHDAAATTPRSDVELEPTDLAQRSALSGPLLPVPPSTVIDAYEDYMRKAARAGTLDGALDALAALASLESAVRGQTSHLVHTCRALQASWNEVGIALGMTRQSAHARFVAAERDSS